MFEQLRATLTDDWIPWIRFALVFLALLISFQLARRLVIPRLRTRTRGWAYDLFYGSLERPLKWLLSTLALRVALDFGPASLHSNVAFLTAIKLSFILIGIWFFHRLVKAGFQSPIVPSDFNGSTRLLLSAFSHLLLYGLGLLIVLDTLRISITPILASLGVGSIAVALALQDTLANFFSGVYLLIDRPIQVGDTIRLDNGVEGRVVKIGWRSTQVHLANETMLVLPNSKLSTSQIINFDLPNKDMVVQIDVGVSYESKLTQVEEVALEVGREQMLEAWGRTSHVEPLVRFTSFAESSIGMSLSIRIPHYSQAPKVKHELVKALHREFTKHRIEIPYPQRVVRQATVTKSS